MGMDTDGKEKLQEALKVRQLKWKTSLLLNLSFSHPEHSYKMEESGDVMMSEGRCRLTSIISQVWRRAVIGGSWLTPCQMCFPTEGPGAISPCTHFRECLFSSMSFQKNETFGIYLKGDIYVLRHNQRWPQRLAHRLPLSF